MKLTVLLIMWVVMVLRLDVVRREIAAVDNLNIAVYNNVL